jgi:hypothetical protein
MAMLQQYYRIDQCTGISISLMAEGSMLIDACSVVRQKNKLNFHKKLAGMTSMEYLKRHVDDNFPVALNLTGKGVLHKQIGKVPEITEDNFNKILPNTSLNDFYIQNFISGEHSFVSVIRKAEVNRITDQLTALGYQVLQLSLGPYLLQHILPQLNIYEADFVVNGHAVLRNEDSEWTGYQYKEQEKAAFPLKVDTEPLAEGLIIPYAAAFQLLLASDMEPVQAGVTGIMASYQKVISEKKLRLAFFFILGVFFISLLLNFIIFSWLTADNNELAVRTSLSAKSSDEAQRFNASITRQESFLAVLGGENNIRKSIIIDQLAVMLPPEVAWTEMNLNPVDLQGSRLQKSPAFRDGTIRINGNCLRIVPVNEWIARVKTLPWVKEVQLESFLFNSELATGQFTIIIGYGNH